MTAPDPTIVGSEVCCDEAPETFCDLDVTNNVWVEGVVNLAAGMRGICMLDSMTKEEVIYVLEHDPKAREDLVKVTSNQELLSLLAEVPLLPREDAPDVEQHKQVTAGLPFYTVFRGQPPSP